MKKYILIAIMIVIIIGIITLIKKLHKNKSLHKNMSIKAEDKLREEALDRIILNDKAMDKKAELFSAKPFDVNYDSSQVEKMNDQPMKKKRGNKVKTMVQIVENSELSSRKYMLDPEKKISIGSKKGRNDIVIASSEISDIQCEILEHEGKVYIRNVGRSGKVVLIRGKQRAFVEQKAAELKNDDGIILEKTMLRVNLVNC